MRPFAGRLALAAGVAIARFNLSRLVALPALALAMGVVPAAMAAVPAAAATTTYTVTDLGSLGLGVSRVSAINAIGQVTGYSYLSTEFQVPCPPRGYDQQKKCFEHPYHAFVWSNGAMTDLGTLGGNFSQGVAINRSGEVVGTADTKVGSSDSFLWNGKTMVDLGSAFRAYGINDSGQIAGACTSSTGSQPCVDSNGKTTVLPDPPNLSCGGANAINNTGQVLGLCGDSSGNSHGVVWTNGTPTVLPTLGGPYFAASAINNLGQVTGFGQTGTYAQHGFLWSNGTMTDLGNNFFAAALNDNGMIVGGNEIYSGGALQNLQNLIPAGSPYQIMYANGINDNGLIAADATDTAVSYQGHAVLLTPN